MASLIPSTYVIILPDIYIHGLVQLVRDDMCERWGACTVDPTSGIGREEVWVLFLIIYPRPPQNPSYWWNCINIM